MDLTQLANLGEFIGGVAVLVTLVYLALQVKQNTRALAATTFGSVSRASADLTIAIATSDQAVESMRLAYSNPQELTADQRLRFDLLTRAGFRNFENYFYQNSQGFLESDVWQGFQRNMTDLLQTPIGREWWSRHKHAFGDRFQDHVGQLIPESEGASVWTSRDQTQ